MDDSHFVFINEVLREARSRSAKEEGNATIDLRQKGILKLWLPSNFTSNLISFSSITMLDDRDVRRFSSKIISNAHAATGL